MLAEIVELLGGALETLSGLFRSFERLEGQGEMKQREGVPFGEAVSGADVGGLPQRGGARLEMDGGLLGVETGEAPQGDAHVVERDAPGDFPLGRFRAIAPASNLPEFARAFSCKSGDPMVRSERCEIW